MATREMPEHLQGTLSVNGADMPRWVYQAILLKGGIGLMISGVKPAGGWTQTSALHAVGQITGKSYPRSVSGLKSARHDLAEMLETYRASLQGISQ